MHAHALRASILSELLIVIFLEDEKIREHNSCRSAAGAAAGQGR
jgi:hypothetical protein